MDIERLTRDRVEYVTREVMRMWLSRPADKMARRCITTRLAKALEEDRVLIELRSNAPDLERRVRAVLADVGAATVHASRVVVPER